MAITMKNGKQVKNFYSVAEENGVDLSQKRIIISNLQINKPLRIWPKDKERLLYIINNYLSQCELEKLNNIVDDVKEEEQGIYESEDKEKYEALVDAEQPSQQSEEVNNEGDNSQDSEDDMFVGEDEYVELPDQIYDVENCSAKVLGHIVRILNFRSIAIRKIRAMRKAKLDNERINSEIEKVAIYNIVLAKYLPILNKQEIVDKINLTTANKLFEEVCVEGYQDVPTQSNIEQEIKKNKEDQDFDIVAALNYVGITLDKDDYGFYAVKNYNNGKGIKYFIGKHEKAFAISKSSCHRFIDEFLNKPIEKRKFITPGQVFITYINEAEKSLGINSRSAMELSGLFGTTNDNKSTKQYFKEMIKKYSRNSEEWKDFRRLYEGEFYSNKESKDDQGNKVLVRQQAKRLVIGELFEDLINHGDILTDEQININDYRLSDISRDFGLDINIEDFDVNKGRIDKLEDQAFRIVNAMHGILQELRAFTQDIIDNYTVDYLRKEKIFLLQQDDQNEYIRKKKEFEGLIKKLSYDKAKDSAAQIAYCQKQIDELTQKIGDKEYVESKNTLVKSKNNFRILLINAKVQKEKVKIAIKEAREKARISKKQLTIDDILKIIKEVLTTAPELVINFEKGKATSWEKHKVGERVEKQEESLLEVDKIIESTAARISDESHQKILQENLIREKVKKSEKEERVKSVNAYINAYGSIVGGGLGVGAFNENIGALGNGPTFAPQVNGMAGNLGMGGMFGGTVATPRNIANLHATPLMYGDSTLPEIPTGAIDPNIDYSKPYKPAKRKLKAYMEAPVVTSPIPAQVQTPVAPAPVVTAPVQPQPTYVQQPVQQPVYVQPAPQPVYPQPPVMPQPQPQMNPNYQNFDFLTESVEPCIIPYVVAYEDKGQTVYGNALEKYATVDRYKFLLTTNNNALYTYIEGKQAQLQTPEQIISDLHIRYMKNAMAKSGQSTLDSNLATFDYKGDERRFLSQYVAQNVIDMIISDYKELCETIDFDLLKELIEYKFKDELENYIPEEIKNNAIKAINIIGSVIKAIMSDSQIRKTYDSYSSKMKQTYISSLVSKIDNNEIPSVKLNSEDMYSRILDYLSFSIKGQNVIIQNSDAKDNGLSTYPRSIFFKQKENADKNLQSGKILSFEQNEILTTRSDMSLQGLGNDVVNLFGTLYNFNGAYNKLLLKLKPANLTGGVKFMENITDALNEKLDMKVTVLEQEKKKKAVTLVKFASKDKEKVSVSPEEMVYNYEDDNWFVRKGFVLDKNRVKDYYIKIAFGFKYALDKEKKALKEDFYKDNILSLPKINEKFKDMPEEMVSLITAVIRDIMMSKVERIVDLIDYVNDHNSTQTNKMLYVNKMIMESNIFDKKTNEEKMETLIALDKDFVIKADDMVTPHPEIYATTSEIEKYESLYMYYSLTELFEKYGNDERFITKELSSYFEELKKKFRSNLLAMIRDRVSMTGYEQDLVKYYELKADNIKTVEAETHEDEEEEVVVQREVSKIKNIDIMFKGILDGFNNALKEESSQFILDQMNEVKDVLEIIGNLPGIDSEDKELEIALPNNQAIKCNIKGFLQQYIFRYIVDKEHELGPFAYVVGELVKHEELADKVKNIEIVANKLNAPELGINLIAKFSSIDLSNNGKVLKVGEKISTVIETINRLKAPTDQQKALNRDVFYKEGVQGVKELFKEYFERIKAENII